MASKTARASAVKEVVKQKGNIPDVELVRLERLARASGIFSTCSGTDAVIRTLDATLVENKMLAERIVELTGQVTTAKADVEHLTRQLTLANSIIATYKQAQADIATVAGVTEEVNPYKGSAAGNE